MVLNALKIRKVAMQSFLNGANPKASLKFLIISTIPDPIVDMVNGVRAVSSLVDFCFMKTAGTIAISMKIIPTHMASVLVAVSALGNQSGSYMITQSQGASTQAHCPIHWAIAMMSVLS